MAAAVDMSVGRYYAWLSWFQDAARRVSHDTGQRTFTVHRHLRADDGTVSGEVLHALLLDAVRATADASTPATLEVLDAGCGLGGTVFYLGARLDGRFTGITASETQRDRAVAEGIRRGLADRCRFLVHDYDADLGDLLPSGADLVVAIESLAHAPDPAVTIGRLARALRPGGRLVLVDDVPRDALPDDDVDLVAFRNGWLCPAVAPDAVLATALAAADLAVCRDEDLTPRVPLRPRAALSRRLRLHRATAALLRLTPAGVLLGALGGGLHLERLYRREMVRYRLIVARRPGRAHPPGRC